VATPQDEVISAMEEGRAVIAKILARAARGGPAAGRLGERLTDTLNGRLERADRTLAEALAALRRPTEGERDRGEAGTRELLLRIIDLRARLERLQQSGRPSVATGEEELGCQRRAATTST
jgi:hypothetical protein